ncbi:MAG: hypothetical protein NTW52_08135 [Planctomycetota bacterium]|nr:hypothetical protein [Planctomycetota bacterium]
MSFPDIRQVVQYQIQSLTERREVALISVKWMEDFEATQLGEFQKLRELVISEPVVKPQEDLAEELPPADSK